MSPLGYGDDRVTNGLKSGAPNDHINPFVLTAADEILSPVDATFPAHVLLGVLHPADELVASKQWNVVPSIKRRLVGDQRDAQVCGEAWVLPRPERMAGHEAATATHSHAALRMTRGSW
jgi:hypothetical protein